MIKNCFLIVIFSSLLLNSCKKDDNDGVGSFSPSPLQLDSFPLAIGNSWKYYTETILLDSNGQVFLSLEYDNYWTVISDTVINGWAVSKIQQTDSSYNGSVHIAYTYYANKSDGFYGVAVENMGSMFNLKSETSNFNSKLNMTFGAPSDSIFIPITPLQFLKFPSNLYDSWYVLTHIDSTTLYQNRVFSSFQTVNTSVGVFNCIRLKANMEENGSPDTNYTVYQDFSSKGLIREIRQADLTFGGGASGKLIQTTRLVDINF
jgi:hypothetical protein